MRGARPAGHRPALDPAARARPDEPPAIDKLTGGCGQSCHNEMINPLGFAFENFDGMGQWRDTENGGLTIEAGGSYTFADGTTRPGPTPPS